MTHRKFPLATLAASCAMITACGDSPAEQEADRMEEQMEMKADQSAAAAGMEEAALGLTETQLLDADLLTTEGTDLGEVEMVRRGGDGAVTGLVVELEGTDPDRWVEVPMDGLTPVTNGDDMDIQTSMTAEELAALPDADMSAMTAEVAL